MSNKSFEKRWMREFVARLEHRMEYLNINKGELARRAKLTPGTVSNWFHYKNGPTAMNLVKIAKVLAVKPAYLIDFPDSTYEDNTRTED